LEKVNFIVAGGVNGTGGVEYVLKQVLDRLPRQIEKLLKRISVRFAHVKEDLESIVASFAKFTVLVIGFTVITPILGSVSLTVCNVHCCK